MSDLKVFQQGDLVRLPAYWNNEAGLVYETYQDFDDKSKLGVSIITESGRDLGGFSFKEQQKFLNLIKRTGQEYDFKNVIQLVQDFKNGLFKETFAEVPA